MSAIRIPANNGCEPRGGASRVGVERVFWRESVEDGRQMQGTNVSSDMRDRGRREGGSRAFRRAMRS